MKFFDLKNEKSKIKEEGVATLATPATFPTPTFRLGEITLSETTKINEEGVATLATPATQQPFLDTGSSKSSKSSESSRGVSVENKILTGIDEITPGKCLFDFSDRDALLHIHEDMKVIHTDGRVGKIIYLHRPSKEAYVQWLNSATGWVSWRYLRFPEPA